MYRLSAAAQADIEDILFHSQEQFGNLGRQRYQALIVVALRDVAANPHRPGSIDRPELGTNARSWHLRHSKPSTTDPRSVVKKPRHMLIYRVEATSVAIARVLHDAMELTRHMEARSSWE